MIKLPVLKGILATVSVFAFYVLAVSTISSPVYLLGQLNKFWYYIVLLAAGFGVQIGLYSYLRTLHCERLPKAALAASSSSSVLAMLACCAHYLITILPVFGIMSFVAAVYKYQVQLFWTGLLFSVLGIVNLLRQVRAVGMRSSH